MKKRRWRRPIFVLVGLLVVSCFTLAGCKTEKGTEEENGQRWTKVADGYYTPTLLNWQNGEKRLMRQPDMTNNVVSYFTFQEESPYALTPMDFNLAAERKKAEDAVVQASKGEARNSYFNEKSMQIIVDTWAEVWSYDIQRETVTLLFGTYEGKTKAELWDSALEQWGEREGYDLTLFDSPLFSPDGRTMIYSANKDCIVLGGTSLFVYDFNEKKETRLLAAETGEENYACFGWVNDQWLLGTNFIPAENGGQNAYFIFKPDGTILPLELGVNAGIENSSVFRPQGGCILYGTWIKGESWVEGDRMETMLWGLYVEEDGSTERVLECHLPNTWVNDVVRLSPDKGRIAYMDQPDPYSWDRNLCIMENGEDVASAREILPVNLGEKIFTGMADFDWLDDNRLLVNIREEWGEQTTYSTWVLDLRSEDAADKGPVLAEGARDESTMAEAYLTVIDHLYNEDKGLNGKEGELKYMAVDTQDMLWLTAGQKEILFRKLAEKYKVEVLEKTYVQLKDEGYLEMQGNIGHFADGMLLKITGGYFDRNIMKLEEAFKWRSGDGAYGIRDLVVEFKDEGWELIDAGKNWIS